MYQCPHCDLFVRTVSKFHQHYIAHEQTRVFKCSKCVYTARHRPDITKHIEESPKATHEGASWTFLARTLPENKYAEYLKLDFVPEFSSPSTTEDSTIMGSCSNKVHPKIKKEKSSSNSEGIIIYLLYQEKIVMFIIFKEDKSSELGQPRQKKMRLESVEDFEIGSGSYSEGTKIANYNFLFRKSQTVFIVLTGQSTNDTDQSETSKLLDNVLASSSFQKAEGKRQQDEQNILEKQQTIDFMKKKLHTLEEINKLRLQELLQFIERKKAIADRIERLVGRKAALESQIRICQCEVLKLQLANTKEEATKEALNSCQRKCDDLENQQEEVDSSVSESREELQEMNQKLAETKESLAVVNQRVHFTKSNINEEESSLRLFQESFTAAMLKIRNVEEVLLSALDDYVRGSSEDVIHPATVTSTPGKLINSYSINFQCQYLSFLQENNNVENWTKKNYVIIWMMPSNLSLTK